MSREELIEASKDLLANLQDEPSKYVTQAPECISQLLALIDSLQADLTQSELVIRAKMTCIDEQAQEIQKLRAELTGCSPGVAGFIATPLENKIIWHDIDLERAKEQIKSLQAALVKERFWKIWREGKHTSVREATELAKKQLRTEIS